MKSAWVRAGQGRGVRFFKMRKNYIILAHNKPKQLLRLISRLEDGQSFFFVHIDANVRLDNFDFLKSKKNVFLLDKRVKCFWGDISLVDATLLTIHEIISNGYLDGYTILLSAQDYPIVSNEKINQFFEENDGFDFIDCLPVEKIWDEAYKRLSWYRVNALSARDDPFWLEPFNWAKINSKNNIKLLFKLLKTTFNHRVNINIKINLLKLALNKRNGLGLNYFGGSQWFALSSKTLKSIMQFHKTNPGYHAFHTYTHVPDEIFFQTIIKHLQDSDSSIRLAHSLTYVNWKRMGCQLPVTFVESDFQELSIASNQKLFARKFDADRCSRILDMLDQNTFSLQ